MTIARQWFDKYVPEVTLSTIEGRPFLGNGSLDTFTQHKINEEHAMKPSTFIRDNLIFSSERMVNKDYYSKDSVAKNSLS
jgi:hypothetical protein